MLTRKLALCSQSSQEYDDDSRLRQIDLSSLPSCMTFCAYSRRSRIFLRRGPGFVWSAMSTRFSGGGGSSRIFPRSPKPYEVQWGGGSSRIFPWTQIAYSIRWGGGSSAEFLFSVTSKGHFPLMGPFFSFFTFPKGGPGPPGPPPWIGHWLIAKTKAMSSDAPQLLLIKLPHF